MPCCRWAPGGHPAGAVKSDHKEERKVTVEGQLDTFATRSFLVLILQNKVICCFVPVVNKFYSIIFEPLMNDMFWIKLHLFSLIAQHQLTHNL